MMGMASIIALAAARIVAAGGAPAVDCNGDPSIAWQVEGGFATIRPEASARADALLDAVALAGGRMQPEEDGRKSAYGEIVTMLTGGDAGAPLYTLTYWDRSQERYALDIEVLTPRQVWIRATFASGGVDECEWSMNGEISRQPCRGARLALRRTAGGLRSLISVQAPGGRAGRTCAFVSERLIVGLGDSYASGEGNPDQPTRWRAVKAVADAPRVFMPSSADWQSRDRMGLWDRRSEGPLADVPAAADAQWWDNSCHRSLLSQQALAALGYAAADRHRRVIFLSFACSGATIFDGVAGPRIDTPGYLRPGGRGAGSVALTKSQVEQLADTLCAEPLQAGRIVIPTGAPTWGNLRIRGKRAKGTRSILVPRCGRYLKIPDALLLSVGGNDIGFGGVAAWALLPPRGRLRVDPVPFMNKAFGGAASKEGFGLVCPGSRTEGRCRLNTDGLVRQLPSMFDMLEEVLSTAGFGTVPVRLHSSYPQVTHSEDSTVRSCFGDELGGELYELMNEPWLPTYANVLAKVPKADWLGRWSFGIQRSEMYLIDHAVLDRLNAAIARHVGWTVVPPQEMPGTHGICAADGDLARALQKPATANDVRSEVLAQFGWPRFVNGGWTSDRGSPADWEPYAVRARWVRTATDAALTQSVLDGGTAAPHGRSADDRLSEGLTGALHPTLAMNAAIAERLIERLNRELR